MGQTAGDLKIQWRNDGSLLQIRAARTKALCVDESDLLIHEAARRTWWAERLPIGSGTPDTSSVFKVPNPFRRTQISSKLVDGIDQSQPPGAVGKHSPSCQ